MATYDEVAQRWTHLAHDVSGGIAIAENMTRKRYWDIMVPGDLSDGAQNEHILLKAPVALSGLAVTIIASDDVTENDTDYATLEINSLASGGALVAMMTAVTTKVTGGIDIDALTEVDFTLTTTTLAAESYLVLEVTKTGAGKALPPLLVHVEGYFA